MTEYFKPTEVTKIIQTFTSSFIEFERFIEENKMDFCNGNLIDILFNSKGLKIIFMDGDKKMVNSIPWEEYLKYVNEKAGEALKKEESRIVIL
jgi:hypothetical protein